MRLLLDVHFSPAIAEQLRIRDHDVISAAEDSNMRRFADEQLLAHAAHQSRALVTNNARDFVPIAADWARSGRDHFGLFLTSDRTLPRSRAGFGRLVRVIDDVLVRAGGPDAYRNRVIWLRR